MVLSAYAGTKWDGRDVNGRYEEVGTIYQLTGEDMGICGFALTELGDLCLLDTDEIAMAIMFLFIVMLIIRIIAKVKDIKSLQFSWFHIWWCFMFMGVLWGRDNLYNGLQRSEINHSHECWKYESGEIRCKHK